MIKKLMVTVALTTLTACGGGSSQDSNPIVPPPVVSVPTEPVEPPKRYSAEVSRLYDNYSYFDVGQYAEYGGIQVPKYDGNLSLYTTKHQPTALDNWFTYSDNSGEGLDIYLSDMQGNTTFITNIPTDDPHQNATVLEGEDGVLHVVTSSRGSVSVGEYHTVDPTTLRVEFVKEHYMAYAQPYLYEGEVGIVYSGYQGSTRHLYVDPPQCEVTPIEASVGHYALSTVHEGTLYVVYSDHPVRDTPDPRRNITLKISSDGGCSWSGPELLLDSGEDNVYLKSLEIVGGRPRVLFVQSESSSPTVGTKELKYYNGATVEFVSDIHHNYASGYSCVNLIVTPMSEDLTEGEGDLHIFSKVESEWTLTDVVEGEYNYAKKKQYSDSCDGVISSQDGIHTLSLHY